jgi:acetyltransferase-like isoleucine patch superfamily enzyme
MVSLLEFLIQRLKRDSNYSIESSYSVREYSAIVLERAGQVTRGLFRLPFLGTASGILMCGSHVVLRHSMNCKFGRSVILEDGVHINALGERGIKFGNNVTIGKNSILICTGVIRSRGVGISIGDNSAVGSQSFLGGQGGIDIGQNVIMGPGVRIFSENHNYADVSIPIRLQGESRRGVKIGDDCWIGASVTIVDGVSLGEGSIVAAGAVVTKSFPARSILAGVPGRLIGERGSSRILS